MNNYTNADMYLNNFEQILKEMALEMMSQEIENNISIDFIRCMIPHHRAAIKMCQNLLSFTSNGKLIRLANDIITIQNSEVEKMQSIARTINNYWNSTEETDMYMNQYYQIVNVMLRDMRMSFKGEDINLDFITEMIPHHQGAIAMCQNLLQYTIDPRLAELARLIIKNQTQNISLLQQIRSSIVQR